jgi:hypothetical protein
MQLENFKNQLIVDIDSDRKTKVIIGKPEGFVEPETIDAYADMMIKDVASLCEGLCTLIHVLDQSNVQPSYVTLENCIKHLEAGFADADATNVMIVKPEDREDIHVG